MQKKKSKHRLSLFLFFLSSVMGAGNSRAREIRPENETPEVADPAEPSPTEAAEEKQITIRKTSVQNTTPAAKPDVREKDGKGERLRANALSLASAISRALAKNPEMRVLDYKQEEAGHRVKGAQGALLPRVMLEGNAMLWNSDVKFDLPSMELGEPPDNCIMPIACLTWFDDLFQNIDLGTIRDRFTAQVTVTVAQPITALFALLKNLKVERLGIDLVKLERQAKRLELKYEVTKAYLQVLAAQRYLEIAREALNLVRAHEKQIKVFHEHEVVGPAELLRVEVALQNAIQRIARIEAGVELAGANLNRLMGEDGDKVFRYTEVFADPPEKLKTSLEDLQKQAVRNRPELEIVRTKKGQASAGRKAMRIMLLPEVTVLGRYQFSEGMGAFTPRNTFFAGLAVSWTWEWGSKYSETKAMESKISQARAILENAERSIKLQVRKHYLDVKTSEKNLETSKTALKAAAENLRIQRLKMGQEMKTVTDLLDAQMRFDQTQAEVTTNLYNYYTSLAGLKQAIGKPLKRKSVNKESN